MYVYRGYGHTGGTHGFARVERNTQRLVIIVLGTAAVKLGIRFFSDFREIRSVQRSVQQLSGVWPSCAWSTPGYAFCILFNVFRPNKISFLSHLRYFWLCTMRLFFIEQYIVAQTSQF